MKVVAVFIAFALYFYPRLSGAELSCVSGSGGACPMRPLCPGDSVSYICDVDVADNTLWYFPDGTCDSMHNRIVLIHSSARCMNATNVCGPFTAENCDPGEDQPCTVSTLNVDLSEVANGTLIRCYVTSLSNHDEVGNATIVKAGKPSINASFAGCSNDSVTMQWKQDTDNEYNYVLSATPPVENCDPNCTVQSTTKYEFTGLERGKMYNLTVQASNCVGSTEERKTVYIPKNPPLLWNGVMCKTYSNTSLSTIYSLWKAIPPVLLSGEGLPCASVLLYVITYESDTGELVTATFLPSECSSGECSNSFTPPVDSSASQYSVSVTAVGLGVTSDIKTVGVTNNALLVKVNATSPPVMATCSFLSGFTGDALCRVDFTGPDGVTYTSVSTKRGSAGESVTVELTLNGAALLPSTTYYYLATLEDPSDKSLCVRLIGQFNTGETDCTLSDLEASASDLSLYMCGEGEKAGDIPNGMLCYTGLTPGSTATYSCDKGYELNGTSVLECLPSGMWNGTDSTCTESDSGDATLIIINICAASLLLLVVSATCIIIIYVHALYKKIVQKKKRSFYPDTCTLTSDTEEIAS